MRIEDKFKQNEILFDSKLQSISNKTKDSNVSFGEVLKEYIDDTNNKIVQADSKTTRFVKGEDVNIDEVMIKGQEASLSLQFLTQTRDKLLEGYNQLSRLQL